MPKLNSHPDGSVVLVNDDGTPLLTDESWTDLDDLEGQLCEAGLPVADLREPGRTFYRYSQPAKVTVGYGGFELYGPDVLLRSLCVMPQFRRRGLGQGMVLLLMRRAFTQGARDAYALPSTAGAKTFFDQLGFHQLSRVNAPVAIQSTRQMGGLCSASTPLLARQITP